MNRRSFLAVAVAALCAPIIPVSARVSPRPLAYGTVYNCEPVLARGEIGAVRGFVFHESTLRGSIDYVRGGAARYLVLSDVQLKTEVKQ